MENTKVRRSKTANLKMVCLAAGADDELVQELNPLKWNKLPEELVELVISKLPFSKAVALRQVSKFWKSDVIPRAARHATRVPALLYFNFHKPARYRFFESSPPMGNAWWLQLCNPSKTSSMEPQDFRPSSFSSPRTNEIVKLVNSQGGLLFFAFMDLETTEMRELVVSNPLTSQSRILGLPRPLKSVVENGHDITTPVGVVKNVQTNNYIIVVAGPYVWREEWVTLVYRSSTCTWSNGPSLSPVLATLPPPDGLVGMFPSPRTIRSVCHNGNLYWKAEMWPFEGHVIMFDVRQETWRIVPIHIGCQRVRNWQYWQMATHEKEICIWHVHEGSGSPERNTSFTSSVPVEVLFDPNFARYPREVERLCSDDLELPVGMGVAFKSMHHYEIDGVEKLLAVEGIFDSISAQYFGFSQNGVLYHVMRVFSQDKDVHLKAISHDTSKNSYQVLEGLPHLNEIYDADFSCCSDSIIPLCVWSFEASLDALP